MIFYFKFSFQLIKLNFTKDDQRCDKREANLYYYYSMCEYLHKIFLIAFEYRGLGGGLNTSKIAMMCELCNAT